MGRKLVIGCFLVLLSLVLLSCGIRSEAQLLERFTKETSGIESYYALMEMRIDGRDTVERYEAEQWHVAPEHYRVDVGLPHGVGQRFITDGVTTHIYEEELQEWFSVENTSEHNPRPPFLLSSYWENLLDAQEITLLGQEKMTERNYYLVEIIPRDASPQRQKEIFWLDTKTLMPIRIETYDEDGNLQAELFFKEIILNTQIEDTIFSADT